MQGNALAAIVKVEKGEENLENGVDGDSVKQGHHDEQQMEHIEGQIMETNANRTIIRFILPPLPTNMSSMLKSNFAAGGWLPLLPTKTSSKLYEGEENLNNGSSLIPMPPPLLLPPF
ncbi:hypothetical protein NE237_000947 [Protea cynaroides]|uniref:Uncharacterized protein n=1 Tax=Protea cynaroides TaxID=273540 RepID=A0A9Q0KT29_9MAGN|nr:hypothetical protein NE237_000947 [Protea cynaroides]